MKILLGLIGLLIFTSTLCAQSATTVTGTFVGSNGTAATSGYVEFQVQPKVGSVLYYVSGTGVIAPTTSRCGINSSGQLKNLALSGVCSIWGNAVLTPANTTYTIVIAPNGTVQQTVNRLLISGSTYSLSSPVFSSPTTLVPQYQTITTQPIYVNLIPAAANTYTVGTALLPYAAMYVNSVFASNIGGPLDSLVSTLLSGTTLTYTNGTITTLAASTLSGTTATYTTGNFTTLNASGTSTFGTTVFSGTGTVAAITGGLNVIGSTNLGITNITTAGLRLGGYTMAVSTADSCGTGFRCVRVPN